MVKGHDAAPGGVIQRGEFGRNEKRYTRIVTILFEPGFWGGQRQMRLR